MDTPRLASKLMPSATSYKNLWRLFPELKLNLKELLPLVEKAEFHETATKLWACWAQDTEVARIPEFFTVKSFAWFLRVKADSIYPYHRDISRTCGLNFLLQAGMNSKTTMIDSEAERVVTVPYDLGHPVMINTKALHQIDNLNCGPRTILTISFYEPFEEIVERYNSGTLFKSDSPLLKIGYVEKGH